MDRTAQWGRSGLGRIVATGLTALLLSISAVTTGCFGSFKLTRKLHEINRNVSSNKFVQWFVFLGLTILPAYTGTVLIDALIMNSIEFWSGSSPQLGHEDDESPRQKTVELEDGSTLHMTRLEDGMRTRLKRNGETVLELAFQLEDGELAAFDAEGSWIGLAREADEGTEVVTVDGRRHIFESFPVLDRLHTADITADTPASRLSREHVSRTK